MMTLPMNHWIDSMMHGVVDDFDDDDGCALDVDGSQFDHRCS